MNIPANPIVRDVSRLGTWGRSFSRRKACLEESSFLFVQASSKIVRSGVCLDIFMETLCPSGQSTTHCMDIFTIPVIKIGYLEIQLVGCLLNLAFGNVRLEKWWNLQNLEHDIAMKLFIFVPIVNENADRWSYRRPELLRLFLQIC